MGMIRLIETAHCPLGRGTLAQAEGRQLAVFHLGDPDRFVVTSHACPHEGGPLSAGTIEHGHLTCPWHYWQFDLNTGESTHSPLARLRIYPSEVRNGGVYVDLDAPHG